MRDVRSCPVARPLRPLLGSLSVYTSSALGSMALIPCDGCATPAPVVCITDYGHEVRYCATCLPLYRAFVAAMVEEEAARQHAYDTWQREQRATVPLRLMPMDFPPRSAGLATLG